MTFVIVECFDFAILLFPNAHFLQQQVGYSIWFEILSYEVANTHTH